MTTDFKLIGIGASAGGLKAIQAFFVNVPTDTIHSFVIIQHLSPTHQNMMPSLLANYTDLPILVVDKDTEIEPGHIYLISSQSNLIIENRILKVIERNLSNTPNLPIDIFFESLSKEFKSDAIGVILSGTGSDGTRGARKIKAGKGLVIVQEPIEAEFDGMPLSAIRANRIDDVFSVHEIFVKINNYISASTFPVLENGNTMSYLKRILLHIKNVNEIDFNQYKLPTIHRFVDRRMKMVKCDTIESYFEYVLEHPNEVEILTKGFLINVTSFFRNPKIWEAFREHLTKQIIEKAKQKELLKVWSVGCSTGEEVYTLAILIHDIITTNNLQCEVKIFGTDLSEENILVAKKGEYAINLVSDIPQDYLIKYFDAQGNLFKIKSFIRNKIVFTKHNILKDYPFYKIDVLLCRNLLIYLESQRQEQVISTFNNIINLNGLLFLGSSETINQNQVLFKELNRKFKIYQNVKKGRHKYLLGNLSYPAHRSRNIKPNIKKNIPTQELMKVTANLLESERQVISILFNKEFQILSSIGKIKNILTFPDSEFTNNLTKMLPKSIGLLISSSIRSLNEERKVLKHNSILYQSDTQKTFYDIIIGKVEHTTFENSTYAILFLPSVKHDLKTADYNVEQVPISRLEELENELLITKKNLEYLVKELEVNNEELQTTNEELLATNEELQSSNEELQSVNEELHTVNVEFQQKLHEIETLNTDMDNLLKSTQIGTIFLDEKKCIRRVTPSIKEQFNLQESDIGRPLAHFTSNFKSLNFRKDLEPLIDDAILHRTSSQIEVQTTNNITYLQRINPFINISGEILGAVISYVDISEIKKLEEDLDGTTKKLNIILEHAEAVISILDLNGKVLYVNHTVDWISKTEMVGSSIYNYMPNPKNRADLKKHIEIVQESKKYSEYQSVYTSPSGYNHYFLTTISPVIQNGVVTSVVTINLNVSDIKKAQKSLERYNQQLERKNKALEEFAYIASHDLREPIRTIIGFMDILKKRLHDNNETIVQQGLKYIDTSAQRMESLVNGLLAHSRVGQEEFNDSIDLNKLILSIKEDLQKLIEETGTKIEVQKFPIVKGYPVALRMLFQNLLSNAIKFRKKTVTPLIKITLEEQPNYWYFKISDNGIGISKEYHERIFKIFQRLNNTKYNEGNGIGLSLCKKYVELHHGKIWVESTEGQGSTFHFTLHKTLNYG